MINIHLNYIYNAAGRIDHLLHDNGLANYFMSYDSRGNAWQVLHKTYDPFCKQNGSDRSLRILPPSVAELPKTGVARQLLWQEYVVQLPISYFFNYIPYRVY